MKKILVGVVMIAVVIFLIVGLSNIGPLIKKAVNTVGPEITKTKVSLGDVNVSIFSGETEIKDFLLGNPKGFKTPLAMKVSSVSVDLDEGSITENTIVINKIEIIAPKITFEKKGNTDNFKAILANVKKSLKVEKESKQSKRKEEVDKPGKKILIKNVIIKDGEVNLAMDLLAGKTIKAPFPDIHLKDIGKENQGATPAEAFEKIFESIYSNISVDSVTSVFNKGIEGLGLDTLKFIPEDGGKAAKKVVKSVTTELESASDKIIGLFKSD